MKMDAAGTTSTIGMITTTTTIADKSFDDCDWQKGRPTGRPLFFCNLHSSLAAQPFSQTSV
jgi:hypothetical protein